MTFDPDDRPLTASQYADQAATLGKSLALADGALGAALLAQIDAQEALWSIKDVGTGRYVHANKAMAALFGRTPDDLIGHIDAELHEPEQAAVWRNAEIAAVARDGVHTADHRVTSASAKREFRVVRMVLPAAVGAPRHFCSIWTETTAEKQRETQFALALQQLEQAHQMAEAQRRQLQETTVRDAVTGVFQAEHFDDQLRRELDLSSREHREFALVSVALDPGHPSTLAGGDEGRTRVREALGRLLRSNTRAMDGACRIEEDRFAILLSGVGLATAHARMEWMRRQCATQIVVLDGQELSFTVSMGVASFPHTSQTHDELLAASAGALQQARERGGNHVALASISFSGNR